MAESSKRVRGAELNIFARLLKTPMITVVGKYLSTVEFFCVEEMIQDQGIRNGFCDSLDITGIMVQAMRRDRLCIICNRTCKKWARGPDPSCPSRIIMGHQGCITKKYLCLYGSIKKRYKEERPRIMYIELPIFKPFIYYKWKNIRIDSWFTKENKKTRNRVAGLPSTMEGLIELNDRFHNLAKRIMVNMFHLTEDERVLVTKQIFKNFAYGHYGFLRQIVEMMQDEVQVKNTFILHSRKVRLTGEVLQRLSMDGYCIRLNSLHDHIKQRPHLEKMNLDELHYALLNDVQLNPGGFQYELFEPMNHYYHLLA